jgi:beta-galactosidase
MAGPLESCYDRKTGATIGIYRTNDNYWDTHYMSPQENANRCDIRWAELPILNEKVTG